MTACRPATTGEQPEPACARRYRALRAVSVSGRRRLHVRGRPVVITMFVEPIKKEFGLGDTQLGLMTGIAFAVMGGVASVPPLARWADRGNRKWIIGGSHRLDADDRRLGRRTSCTCWPRASAWHRRGRLRPATHPMIGDDYYPRHLRPRASAHPQCRHLPRHARRHARRRHPGCRRWAGAPASLLAWPDW